MKRSWKASGGFLAALLFSPALWGSVPPQPGTLNYIEGQAAIGSQALTDKSVGSARLEAGQSLSTDQGRAEILLTPGIFLRVDDRSSLQMVSPGLADTITTLQKGRAMVEVADIRRENNVRIGEDGSSTQLLKAGLYDFDADRGMIRVFDGKALVQTGGRNVELKSGHELLLNAGGNLKPRKFDKKEQMDDFYRWSSLRASYLAEANVDQARRYAGGAAWAPGWYGLGWYWDPWFSAYTFIPGDGIFYDPFGWGFYSPWYAFGAPYVGFGYGFGGYYHHFGPGYRPPVVAGARGLGYGGPVGHAYNVRGFGGAGFRGAGPAGSFRGPAGGFHGNAIGGFRGGAMGGFHGGGFGGRGR